ncbi:hypothetical protein [Variovorax sp. HJSM1_2]|uniref:hypothetical protein n=1 Tax=Variovorax sp. HJSM1_2 TaxID=3366263 RepID=UPI003BDEA8E6
MELSETGRGDMSLQIDRLARLFEALPFDPAHPEMTREPGVDVLAERISDDGTPPGGRLRITVTEQEVTPAQAETVTRALRVYCEQRAQALRREVARVRRNGRSGLKGGIPTLALALVLSALCEQFAPFPAAINRLFSEGLLVLGWVVLWHPLEILLYAWRAPIRLAKAYERLAQMPVLLQGRPATP